MIEVSNILFIIAWFVLPETFTLLLKTSSTEAPLKMSFSPLSFVTTAAITPGTTAPKRPLNACSPLEILAVASATLEAVAVDV